MPCLKDCMFAVGTTNYIGFEKIFQKNRTNLGTFCMFPEKETGVFFGLLDHLNNKKNISFGKQNGFGWWFLSKKPG